MGSAEEWLSEVRAQERRGELIGAFDIASRGLDEHPDDLRLRHRAVLALARAGATAQASDRFREYGLDQIDDDEDVTSLRARIAKDAALAETDSATRRRRAIDAAELYAAVYARTGGYYPAINAATLWLLAGDRDRARVLARRVLAVLKETGEDSYYAAATAAEAELLLGDTRAASREIERAGRSHGGDYAALATTRRQLRLICDAEGIDAAVLAPLAGPGVAHFCGHIISAPGRPGRFPSTAEELVAARIREVVARHPTQYAYGSLAGGADVMWAETLLGRGCELHIVLPFARDEFVERSVAVSGGDWVERFVRCIEAATEVLYATNDAFLGDDVLFRYCSELAMGQALLRAAHLDAHAWQFALWDGQPTETFAGTATDVATWRRTGLSSAIVVPDGRVREERSEISGPVHQSSAAAPSRAESGRVVRAMAFGDIRGFSKLTDEQLPAFSTHVLGALAGVIDRYAEAIEYRNTWGDALYLVISDPGTAAECVLDLQDAMTSIDLAGAGLPDFLALRLGAHLGPVFRAWDPVLKTTVFTGSHVSRTARIEPVTPPGAVYVTTEFASALVLASHHAFNADYVGHMPAAKGYGHLRMFRLRRTDAADHLSPG